MSLCWERWLDSLEEEETNTHFGSTQLLEIAKHTVRSVMHQISSFQANKPPSRYIYNFSPFLGPKNETNDSFTDAAINLI